MNDLQDLLRDAIDAAKKSGVWQILTLDEKKSVVEYFYFLFERHFNHEFQI
ncbi:MAG: hypothetical protein HY754_00010 [Nitrospirae bacterium]|nr:hypothetical protein [Nitrospirota bacterium]